MGEVAEDLADLVADAADVRRRGRPRRDGPTIPPLELDPAQEGHLKDRVYQQLLRAIVEHRLPPGTHLKERDVAERMGVSKTPIREAFVRLEKEKLLDVIPYKGAVVRTITRRDLREVYELRELLEGFCARRAAAAMGESDEDRLRSNIRATRAALEAGDVDGIAQLLEEFDQILHGQADGYRIGAILDDLGAQLRLFGRIGSQFPGRAEKSLEQHLAILNAIVAGDGDAAERACRAHVRSVYAVVVAQLPTSVD